MAGKDISERIMKEHQFAKAYQKIDPKMAVIRAMIDARMSQNLTQKKLADCEWR